MIKSIIVLMIIIISIIITFLLLSVGFMIITYSAFKDWFHNEKN